MKHWRPVNQEEIVTRRGPSTWFAFINDHIRDLPSCFLLGLRLRSSGGLSSRILGFRLLYRILTVDQVGTTLTEGPHPQRQITELGSSDSKRVHTYVTCLSVCVFVHCTYVLVHGTLALSNASHLVGASARNCEFTSERLVHLKNFARSKSYREFSHPTLLRIQLLCLLEGQDLVFW
jgi:hypothetical protein